MIKLTFILLVIAAAVDICYGQFEPVQYNRTAIGDAVDKASMKLLKEAFDAASDKNVVSSPLGVLLLLSIYSAGTGRAEAVRAEIVQALGSANYEQLYSSYTGLSSRLSTMDPSYFTLANKIYVDQKYEVANAFSSGPVRAYHSEVEKLNFNDPTSAAAAINKWSAEKTKGHIKEPVQADSIDPSTAAALVNVIFFQGHWHVPFNASFTEEKDFHVDKSKTVKKPMMHLVQSLFYYESPELEAKMIELPYKESGFRMVVILPNEIDGLPSMLKKIEQKGGILTEVFSLAPRNRDVVLDLPKFEIRSKLNLNDLLPKVGVSKLFSEGATDIVEGTKVVVDKAFQEAFVKVDEEGATAGAFTGFKSRPLLSLPYKRPRPLQFKADHPFFFAILHEDVIFFTGTYIH